MKFIVLRRRADHADAISVPLESGDIDDAALQAVRECPDDEFVCAVWQADTPADILAWHAGTQEEQEGDLTVRSVTPRYFRSKVTLTVLHDEPIDGWGIGSIIEACDTGPTVLADTSLKTEEVTPDEMRQALTAASSDPSFFYELGEEGKV